MTVHNVAHRRARLARALYDVQYSGVRRWEPSREDLLKLRHLSREKFTMKDAYIEMNIPITYETFKRKVKKYEINFEPQNWSPRCVR